MPVGLGGYLRVRRGQRRLFLCFALLAIALLAAPASAEVTILVNGLQHGKDLSSFHEVGDANGRVSMSYSYGYGAAPAVQAEHLDGTRVGYARTAFHVGWVNGDEPWYGLALYLPEGFYSRQQAPVSLLRWDNLASSAGGVSDLGGLSIDAGGEARLERWRSDGSQRSTLVGPFRIPEGTWVDLQVHQRLGAAGSTLNEVYMDDQLIGASSRANTFGRKIDRVAFGIVRAEPQPPLTLYFDRAAVRRERFPANLSRGSTPLPEGSPSGKAMPVGDIPGWRQVFADDFGGLVLDLTKWHPAYDDPPRWRPWHASVGDGILTIDAYRDSLNGNTWTSTGVYARLGRTYGKYVVRFRFDGGKGISNALMVWPSGCWPWEIDIAEAAGSDNTRDGMSAFQHYQGPGGCGDDRVHQAGRVSADFTEWHEIGVEWTPGRLDYTLDGRVWSSLVNDEVPTTPGHLVLQTEACNPICPDDSTPAHVRMQVDWAVVYAPDPAP